MLEVSTFSNLLEYFSDVKNIRVFLEGKIQEASILRKYN